MERRKVKILCGGKGVLLVEAITEGPLWLFDIPKPRALLVVAHPDDETIFAGGLILCSRRTRWTIICCTTESQRRQEEFLNACQFLAEESGNRVDPVSLGLVDGHIDRLALAKELRSYATGYDIVLPITAEESMVIQIINWFISV